MALHRHLTFDGTSETDKRHVRFLWEAFVLGGTLANNDRGRGDKEKSFDVRRREGKIARKLKAITEPIEEKLATGDPERTLRAGTQELVLEQAEHDLLIQYIEKTPWKPNLMDEIEDMVDAFSAAEKKEPSSDAK